MADGLKLINDIYQRAREQYKVPMEAWYGIDVAVVILSDTQNLDLWKRMVAYCGEVQQGKVL